MAGEYGVRTSGTSGRLFADPQPGPDETSFQVDNTSEQYYNSAYYKLHQSQLQPVPPPRVDPPRMQLAGVLSAEMIGQIQAAGRITFHAVGDTGAAQARAIPNEAGVADAMARDVAAGGPDTPAFFFHLGDVVYSFGEAQYYYDQFYEPLRAYDRPVFAIPGNHDGFPESAAVTTLAAFLTNFCAASPGPSPNAGGLVRSTMTQPGVYFTLDAPLVSIIGLYTNVLEGPGVISTQGGTYSSPMNDDQLAFLTSELTRLRADPDRLANRRAVVIACHHPPASADQSHGGSTGLSADIDRACQAAGIWPDAVLSGHAHLYQRFTRSTGTVEIPYVVSGSGGYGLTPPRSQYPSGSAGGFTLSAGPLMDYGYLVVTVDVTASPVMTVTFRATSGPGDRDSVTVDLTRHSI